jgi:exodeoxyribonuclease-3
MADYGSIILFNVYFPNGKASRERLDYKLKFYALFLDQVDRLKAEGQKIVIWSDINTAHIEMDLARPKQNEKISGFLPVERAWMDKLVLMAYWTPSASFTGKARTTPGGIQKPELENETLDLENRLLLC